MESELLHFAPEVLLLALTYLVHSTVLVFGVWITTRWIRNAALAEKVWKWALIAPLATVAIQCGLTDGWTLPLPRWVGTDASDIAIVATDHGPNQNSEWDDEFLYDSISLRDFESMRDEGSGVQGPNMAATLPADHVQYTTSLETGLRRAPEPIPMSVKIVAATLLGISVLLVLRTGATWFRLLRWIRQTSLAPEDLQREVDTFAASHDITQPVRAVTADTSEPCASGILSWVIVFPNNCESRLPTAELQALIAHELAHLVRRDPAWVWISQLLCNAFWFQPMNRLVASKLRGLSEVCSDDWAIRHDVEPLQLARCLTSVASWIEGNNAMPVAPAATGNSHGHPSLTDRIERLIANECRRPDRGHWMPVAVMVIVSMVCLKFLPRAVWANSEAVPRVAATGVESRETGSLEEDLQALVVDLNRVERLLGDTPDPDVRDVAQSLKKRFVALQTTLEARKQRKLTNEGVDR